MSQISTIEWTEATWNPVTGCTKCSQGCKNCYAARQALWLEGMGNPRYENGFDVTLHHDLIERPRFWSKPRIIFVNSMSDLFHEEVPFQFIRDMFETMVDCPQHTFQILTKRSERLRKIAARLPWPENIWMGVSVEDADVNVRIGDLVSCPAHIKFLSCEPLIGRVDFMKLGDDINWVIAGGESGPKARPMHPEWARSVRDQCIEYGIPFFFKQWGAWSPKPHLDRPNAKTMSFMDEETGEVAMMYRLDKKRAGCVLDGREWKEMPVVE